MRTIKTNYIYHKEILMAYKDDQQKRMSYSFATLFSTEKKGNEYQLLRIGFYDGKLTFNFSKGTSGGGGEAADAYTSLNYDVACMFKRLLDSLVKRRIERFRAGDPYEDVYFNYAITFQDRETHETRTAGTLTVKTEINPETRLNTIHIYFDNGVNKFDIALGAGFLNKSFTQTEEYFTDIDVTDAKLYSTSYLFNHIISSWPALMQNDRIASLFMTRLNAISEKLGISYDNNQGDKGNYQEKYRSGEGRTDPGGDTPF
jgi:hypothetical protein